MKTNCTYIHEFDIVDEFYEESTAILESLQIDIDKYYKTISDYELKSFFENSNIDENIVMEREGIVTRIGNAVIALIKKIRDSISKFVDKLLHRNKKVETDIDTVNKMISEHPEIRDIVVKGIREEWLTYRDVAAYEKDMVQLMIMLDKQKIDHKTFKDKSNDALDKFLNGGQKVMAIGSTIAGILFILPKVVTGTKKCKSAGSEVADMLSKKSKKMTKTTVKESTDNTDTIQNDNIILAEASNVYNIINKYNNLQLANLEKIAKATKSTAKSSLGGKQNKNEGDSND